MLSRDFYIFSALIIAILGAFISLKASDLTKDAELDRLVEKIAEPYDLAQSIKAIIYIESRNGEYPVNLQDPACGVTHIHIKTYMKRHKVKDTPFNRNKACSDLINSPEWAILNALQELMFWKAIHCKDGKCTRAQYRNMIKSYNTGWNYKGAKGREYWDKFQNALKQVKGKSISTKGK